MGIKYICYHYGHLPGYYKKWLHLVRYTNGQGILLTTEQLRARGL